MSAKKDFRRVDLAVPYIEPAAKKDDGDIAGAMTSTLPMAAIFTRNKYIGLTAVAIAIQNWLAETPDSKKTSATPAILSVGLAFMSLLVTYMPLFTPPIQQSGAATAPPAPMAS